MQSTSRVHAQFLILGDTIACNGEGAGVVEQVIVDPTPKPTQVDVLILVRFADGRVYRLGYHLNDWVALV